MRLWRSNLQIFILSFSRWGVLLVFALQEISTKRGVGFPLSSPSLFSNTNIWWQQTLWKNFRFSFLIIFFQKLSKDHRLDGVMMYIRFQSAALCNEFYSPIWRCADILSMSKKGYFKPISLMIFAVVWRYSAEKINVVICLCHEASPRLSKVQHFLMHSPDINDKFHLAAKVCRFSFLWLVSIHAPEEFAQWMNFGEDDL